MRVYRAGSLIPAFALVLLLVMAGSASASEPIVYDENYSLTLVATGLGAANAIAIDDEGNLFVTDYRDPGTGDGKIYWFKPDGEMEIINSRLYYQSGIAILPDNNLLVATNDLYKVTRDGIVTLYLTGLSFPVRIKPDGLGNYYIAEGGSGEITILYPDKSTETFASGFNNPNAVAFDDQGNVWVTEHNLGMVIELDNEGRVLQEITGFTTYGPVDIEFWDDSLFVTNPQDATIARIEKDGSWQIFATGFTGKENPPFIGPNGLLAVESGLYVADADNLWKITIVAPPPPPTPVPEFGGLGFAAIASIAAIMLLLTRWQHQARLH